MNPISEKVADISLNRTICSLSRKNSPLFKKSKIPVKLMVFEDRTSGWVDLPPEALDAATKGYTSKEPTVKVDLQGAPHLLDFLSMLLIKVGSRSARSIAWEDSEGKSYRPRKPVNCQITSSTLAIDDQNLEPTIQPSPILRRIKRTHHRDKEVKEIFLKGMAKDDPAATVTAVYTCLYTSQEAVARLLRYQSTSSSIREKIGSPHVKWSWFGTSARRIESIVMNGFENGDVNYKGSDVFGPGLCLSAAKHSYVGARRSKPDAKGDYHVLLCRVILGKVESIRKDPDKIYPSNETFDCGVDDIKHPSCYIVRMSKMNTHIIPECVVSFKVSPHIRELWKRRQLLVAMEDDSSILSIKKKRKKMKGSSHSTSSKGKKKKRKRGSDSSRTMEAPAQMTATPQVV